jgi:hypothetical protein
MDTSAPLTIEHEPAGASQASRLLRFNDDVLAQGEALAQACESGRFTAYETSIGPHLRHVIEHYEALLLRPAAIEVDYDQRPRDRTLERSPALARRRFAALRAALRAWAGADLENALLVFTLGGVHGQWPLACASTISRELVFLASHAVHHFALLRGQCERHGIAVAPHFGIAPATAAHAMKAH